MRTSLARFSDKCYSKTKMSTSSTAGHRPSNFTRVLAAPHPLYYTSNTRCICMHFFPTLHDVDPDEEAVFLSSPQSLGVSYLPSQDRAGTGQCHSKIYYILCSSTEHCHFQTCGCLTIDTSSPSQLSKATPVTSSPLLCRKSYATQQ